MIQMPSVRNSAAPLLGAWVLMIASCGGSASANVGPGRLELEEVWSTTLPPDFAIRGVTSDSSRVVLWGDSLEYVLEWTLENGLRRSEAPASLGWLAAAPFGDSLIFLDGTALEGVVGRGSGDQGPPVPLEDVSFVGGRWFLAVEDTGGVTVSASVVDSGWQPVFSYRTPMGPHRPRREGLVVTSDGSSLVASSRFYPFTNYAFATSGEITAVFAPIPGVERRNEAPGLLPNKTRMISTGTFTVGTGFVQILSDPFSLERLIITYDADGRLMRTTLLEVPFGVAATVPKHRVLLAVRRLVDTELVAYRWTWR